MDYQSTVVLYELVAQMMRQMLHAAKQQDWQTLMTLELHCAQMLTTVKATEGEEEMPEDLQKRKVESLKSILADDREITNLVSPWMVRLNTMMDFNRTQ